MKKLPEIRRALSLQERIRSAAKALDRLNTGALVAFTGGAFVLGLVAGGILWMPVAMSGSLLFYRISNFLFERKNKTTKLHLETWKEILALKEELYKTQLPENERTLLSRALDRELENLSPSQRLLLPPEDVNRPGE